MIASLVHIGWPIGLTLGFEVSLFSATAILMGTLGTVQLAAHQIALQSASFTFMVPLGLASATAVRVGQAVGRGLPTEVRRAGWTGILLSGSVMMVSALVFWFLPERVVGLFLNVDDPQNTEVVRTAARYLAFAAAFQVVDGLQVAAAGALRGLKDTRVPMLISLFSYWFIGFSSGPLLRLCVGPGWTRALARSGPGVDGGGGAAGRAVPAASLEARHALGGVEAD
jgi:MATE family multidrug resistance protein